MYNYGAPGYTRAPGLPGPPPGMAPPPGMGAPPGMAAPPGMGAPPGIASVPAPGITPPPGLIHAQPPAMGAGRGLPSTWQPPPNMPNINFNAPVIHFGTSGPPRGMAMDGPGGRRESGAPSGRRGGNDGGGRDADQAQRAKDVQSLAAPPSREEIARTIFVGNIPNGVGGDEGMERILACAGNLRRWTRCTDTKNKPCTFGFAEYEDAESLETAIEIFKDLYVPTERQRPGSKVKKEEAKTKSEDGGDVKMEDADEDEVKKTKLQVMVDENSKQYAEDWKKRRGDDDSVTQFRFHTAGEALAGVVASLFNPQHVISMDMSGDIDMQDMQVKNEIGEHGEVVTIQISADDELSEIPEDKRETVAAEIAAFRDRANRRDLERLALEERIEAEERNKLRVSRMGSPPPSAPRGPAGANGVPLGPRADQSVPGAPNGPRGGQFPSDYKGGVAFVNGNGMKWSGRPEDKDPRSDDAIEAQRQEQRRMELDREFRNQERYWLQREGKTVASLRRNAEFQGQNQQMRRRHKEQQAHRLKNWDDTIESQQPPQRMHMYYRDRGIWARERSTFLQTELQDDAVDRAQEDQQLAVLRRQKEIARGKADAFLSEQAEELARRMPITPREPQRFKLSLGAAAKRVEEAAASRRTGADIASLLDDEEEADGPVQKRELVPIKFDPSVQANLTAEEVAEAQQHLAREIPNDKESLWKWNISWNDLPEKNIDHHIKDWAEKKIVESLGVQEDMLVDAIVEHVRQRKDPQSLVEELSEFLEDDAEQLVRKLWRMVIYYSESEKRGIK